MKIEAEPGRAGGLGAVGIGLRRLPVMAARRGGAWRPGVRGCVRVCASAALAWITMAGAAAAQDTVVIGDSPGGPAIVGGGGSNLVIKEDALNSPGTGTANRQPGTGQPVIRRPGTLLFPPPRFPRSKLTVAPVARTPESPTPAARAAPVQPESEASLAETPAEPEAQAAPDPAPADTNEMQAAPAAAAESAAPSGARDAALPAPDAGSVRILFAEGSADLSPAARERLEDLALRFVERDTARVRLLAYAKPSAQGASQTRRLSLSRALAVRAFLIDLGVPSSRLDVRAMGDDFDDGPADRVDILPQNAG